MKININGNFHCNCTVIYAMPLSETNSTLIRYANLSVEIVHSFPNIYALVYMPEDQKWNNSVIKT